MGYKSEKLKFHVLSIKKLFIYGKIEHVVIEGKTIGKRILVIPSENMDFTHVNSDPNLFYIEKQKDDCHLFRQFGMLFPNVLSEEAFIIIDFESANEDIYSQLRWIHGIAFRNRDGELTTYVDFLKSSSMAAKKKQIYYINEKYKERLEEKVTLNAIKYSSTNPDKPNIVIPKWYSATGLLLSTCTILDSLKLSSDEICVIKDYETSVQAKEAIIAISKSSLLIDIRRLIEIINNSVPKNSIQANERDLPEIERIYQNLYAISHSDDLTEINNDDIKNAMMLFSKPFKTFIRNIKKLENNAAQARGILFDPGAKDMSKIDWFKIKVSDYYIETNMFDGEGLVSKEFAEEINNSLKALNITKRIYSNDEGAIYHSKQHIDSGSFQIRLPFIKGVLHTADFQQFFEDNNVSEIKARSFIDPYNESYLAKHGYHKTGSLLREDEYDVKKLKIILTTSQLKFLTDAILTRMFIDKHTTPIRAFFDKLYEYDYGIGINNVDPVNTGAFKMNHEFWSTLPISTKDKEVKNAVLEKTESFIKNTANPNYILNILGENEFYSFDNQYASIDQEFYFNSKMGKDFIKKNFDEYMKEAILGKVYVEGQRRFLSSDLLYLLYRIIGGEMSKDKALATNSFYINSLTNKEGNTSLNYTTNQYIILRAPHYSRNEIVVLRNKINDFERAKYFPNLKGTIMVNPKSLAAERLGGADYDGDAVFIITDPLINKAVNSVIRPIKTGEYTYPIVKIPSLKCNPILPRQEDKIKSWRIGFESKIGLISNIAFAQSLVAYKENSPIADPNFMAFYTLVCGLDIDAKKTGLSPSKYYQDIKQDKFAKEFTSKKNNPYALKKIIDSGKQIDHVLYTFIKEFANRKPPKIKVGDKYKSTYPIKAVTCSKNKGEIIKALKKYFVYQGFNVYLQRETTARDVMKTLEESLYTKANEFNLQVSELFETFKVKNPLETLKEYRRKKKDTPWHYLDSDENKIEYLKNLDFVNSDLLLYLNNMENKKSKYAKLVNCLLSFTNEGYKTLYHIIQHQRFKMFVDSFTEDTAIFEDAIFKNTLINLDGKAKACNFTNEEIKNIKQECLYELKMLISFYKTPLWKANDNTLDKYLAKHINGISINAVKAISSKQKIEEDETICHIFSSVILRYLKTGK